jgi:hypothetical protein
MSGEIKVTNFILALKAIKKFKNWPTYFLDLFNLVTGKKILLRSREGFKFIVRSGTTDRGIITSVFLEDEYRINNLNLVGSIIIDIGAQTGSFSIFSSKGAKRVFSYEPIKNNFSILLDNIKVNNIQNISPFNLAVSNQVKK